MGRSGYVAAIGLAVALLSFGTAQAQDDGISGGGPVFVVSRDIPKPLQEIVLKSEFLREQVESLVAAGWKFGVLPGTGGGIHGKTIWTGEKSPLELVFGTAVAQKLVGPIPIPKKGARWDHSRLIVTTDSLGVRRMQQVLAEVETKDLAAAMRIAGPTLTLSLMQALRRLDSGEKLRPDEALVLHEFPQSSEWRLTELMELRGLFAEAMTTYRELKEIGTQAIDRFTPDRLATTADGLLQHLQELHPNEETAEQRAEERAPVDGVNLDKE
jgi:hypothetical protein